MLVPRACRELQSRGTGLPGGHVGLGRRSLCSSRGPAEVRAGAAREGRTGERLELQTRKGGKDREAEKEVPELKHLPGGAESGSCGYLNHNATKAKAPAYACKGAQPPAEGSCSPGPRYCVEPSMSGNGKYVAAAYAICGLARRNTEITPGPSDYFPEKSNSHIYKCLPVQSTSFQHRAVKTDLPPDCSHDACFQFLVRSRPGAPSCPPW